MSYATGYPRRPRYSNVGFGQNSGRDYGQNSGRDYGQNSGRDHGQNPGRDYGQNSGGQNYGQNYATNYDPNYQNYEHSATYAPRRPNSYNYHPGSQVAYTNGNARYVTTDGRDYYRSHHGYSRHAPNVVVASSRDLGRQATPYVSTSTSARYRAENHRGESIPVVAGVSYRHEGISLSTRIRRLFGLGPRRSSTHVGKSVHVKRWGFGRHGFNTSRQYHGGRGSQSTVYTL